MLRNLGKYKCSYGGRRERSRTRNDATGAAPTLPPHVKLRVEELRDLLLLGVLKREVIEGEKAEAAWKKVQKAAAKFLRTKKEKDEQVIGIPSGEDQEEELVPPKEPVGAR